MIQFILLPALLLAVLVLKVWLAVQQRLAIWDGYGFMANARTFLLGRPISAYHFFEIIRPPIFSYVISLVWRITGENYYAAAVLQPIFTVAAAYVLFLLMKEMFDVKTAFLSSIVLLASPLIFLWTNQLIAHGVGLFFMVLSVYFLWLGMKKGGTWSFALAGAAFALATLTRYPALAFAPVFPIVLIGAWVRSERPKSFPWKHLAAAAFAFVLVWIPWLVWNYVNTGSPLTSVIEAFTVGEASAPEPWYFYIINMSRVLTIPGCLVLLVGLLDRRTVKDKGRLLLLLWVASFFVFHSLLVSKMARYYVEWSAPLAAFTALGVSRIEAHLPSRTQALGWFLVGLVVTGIFVPDFTRGIANVKTEEAVYGSYDDFKAVMAWVNANASQTSIGASDIPTALGYLTDRNYYGLDSLAAEAATNHVALDQSMSEVGVNIIIVTTMGAYANTFRTDANAVLVKEFPSYLIYSFNCLNCTKT